MVNGLERQSMSVSNLHQSDDENFLKHIIIALP
jgi:hypothetical protein